MTSRILEHGALPPSPQEPKSLAAALLGRLRALFSEVKIQRRPRSLRVCETLSLGDKRIVALIECENQRFLVAATAQTISLLQTFTSPQGEDRKPERP